jgi:chemotaxis response regulator CheB
MDTNEPWFVAIGASGPDGIADIYALLQALPSILPAVVLVVLHRPSEQISNLRDLMARRSRMPVVIAETGEKFERSTVYIGEPAGHLTLVERSFGILVGDPQGQYRNRTVDLLFDSVAHYGGDRMIGIVLSGSLDDGARGLAAINHAGGHVMVISSQSTEGRRAVRGMPENAATYDGPIDYTGNAIEIADAVVAVIRKDRSSPA